MQVHTNVRYVEVTVIKRRIIASIMSISMSIIIGLTPAVCVSASETPERTVTVRTFIREIKKRNNDAKIKTGIRKSAPVTVEIAAVLITKADEQLHGTKVSDETVSFIMKNRISDIRRAKKSRREYIAKAYAEGLIAGISSGSYSNARIIEPLRKCTYDECIAMIDRLINEEKRYRMSEDYRLLRIDEDTMPVLAQFYEYVLEDFPNEYYDTVFNFMTNQAMPGEAEASSLWKKRRCSTYCGAMTWDCTYSKLTYNDRKEILKNYDSTDVLAVYSAFLYPCEYDKFAKERREKEGYLGMPVCIEEKQAMTAAAEEYAMHALNIDYRTIDEDVAWKEYMYKNGIMAEDMEQYIENVKKDELIIECDKVAADVAGIYYDRTPFTFKSSEAVVKVYAHYRVVSDNGRSFLRGGLTVNSGMGTQCLRLTRISDDGLSYEWTPTDTWQDAVFDIGMDRNGSGKINTALFNIVHNKTKYIEAQGFPCESECYYPGLLTIDGRINQSYKNMTRKEYLEKWGYRY